MGGQIRRFSFSLVGLCCGVGVLPGGCGALSAGGAGWVPLLRCSAAPAAPACALPPAAPMPSLSTLPLPTSLPPPLPLSPSPSGVKRFADGSVEGYGWAADGGLEWPGKPVRFSVVAVCMWVLLPCVFACGAGVGESGGLEWPG